MDMVTPTKTQADSQFVTLGIDREVFAVPIDTVLEILDMRPLFRVPDAPPSLLGLVDLRGRSVPVIDLRTKLGLPKTPATESTRILVLEIDIEDKHLVVGMVADRVFEVTSLDSGSITPPPDIGTAWRSDYIHGVGRHGEGFVIIFNVTKLFSTDDITIVAKAATLAPQETSHALHG